MKEVLAQIQRACETVGRLPESVRIVAVSKKQPLEKITLLAQEGQMDFGENYVQEMNEKIAARTDLRWHLIGHLQKNKIKQVLGKCHLIHSVDSLELLEAINKRAAEAKTIERVLLQVNVAGEDTKHGFTPDDVMAAVPSLRDLPNVRVRGLMTMPPLQNEPEQNRPHYRELARLLKQLRAFVAPERAVDLTELSMGTSHDFEVAVQEGATYVRVGTILFGRRD